ncbi:MAG: restriction endonuclease subunit S [Rhodococcus sp.]|nr:restriction endonuclease subunit S [Rhodococcus sp. (in: high G+C Gram-positive bacteria)]
MSTLPDGWHRHPLGDLARVKSGFAFKSADWTEHGVPVVKIANVKNSGLSLEDCSFVSTSVAASVPDFELANGDVLISMTGYVGQVCRVDTDRQLLLNQRVGRLTIRDEHTTDIGYLYYYMRQRNVQDAFNSLGYGSAQANISPALIGSIPVRLPPLSQQQAIAEVLAALDDKIAANRKLADTADALAAAIYLGAAAESSEQRALSDVASLISRGVAPKYTEDESELTVLNQKCIRGQRISLAPARRTLGSKVQQPKRLQPNDVLVNSTGAGTLGRVARWTGDDDATVDSHVSIVRFDPDGIDPTCAGFALLHAQKTIEMMGEGSTGQTELSREQLSKLALRFITRDREAAVAEKLRALSTASAQALDESSRLAVIRDTLLPHLMSGSRTVRAVERQVEQVL